MKAFLLFALTFVVALIVLTIVSVGSVEASSDWVLQDGLYYKNGSGVGHVRFRAKRRVCSSGCRSYCGECRNETYWHYEPVPDQQYTSTAYRPTQLDKLRHRLVGVAEERERNAQARQLFSDFGIDARGYSTMYGSPKAGTLFGNTQYGVTGLASSVPTQQLERNAIAAHLSISSTANQQTAETLDIQLSAIVANDQEIERQANVVRGLIGTLSQVMARGLDVQDGANVFQIAIDGDVPPLTAEACSTCHTEGGEGFERFKLVPWDSDKAKRANAMIFEADPAKNMAKRAGINDLSKIAQELSRSILHGSGSAATMP